MQYTCSLSEPGFSGLSGLPYQSFLMHFDAKTLGIEPVEVNPDNPGSDKEQVYYTKYYRINKLIFI